MAENEVPVDERVLRWLAKPRRMLIGGKWVEAATCATFATRNPATEEVLANIPLGDAEDVDRAVRAARRAFEDGPWRRMTPGERGRCIWKLADLVEAHAEEFAQLETLDNGKPLAMSRIEDVALTIDLFRYMAGWATKIEGNTIPLSVADGATYFAYTVREPIGVVGQIIPWNYPLQMASWKLGPALAAGCTVVLKPAEQTPLTALMLGELFAEAGFPDGVVNIVTGMGETAGAALAAHHDVDKVAFTGSTEVGRLILHAAAGNLKKVSLELGGKSPNIVMADADFDAAIPGAAGAIFSNHGQNCCAGSRLYVERKVFDRVIEGVAAEAEKIRLGPGMSPDTEMGPLIGEDHLARVCGHVESGVQEGARIATGGSRHGTRGYYMKPTLVVDAKPNMRIAKEEIFGPVVVAMPFDDPAEIAVEANNSVYGLAAGIWTRDVSKAHRFAARLKAGTVWVNCYNVCDAALPFGGSKQSGWGREMGHEVLNLYTETKAVCVKL